MLINGDAKIISAAYVKARKAMGATVAKDKQGNFGRYATLAAIVEATTGVLADNGLAVIQEASTDETGLVIETWLVHESGTMMQFTPLVLPLTDRRPQAVGSAITYARRYALSAICGIAPDDDDGQAAQEAQKPVARPKSTPALDSTSQAQNGAQHATTSATNDDAPTDGEHDIISQWDGPRDAQNWAMMVGACENEHHASQSWIASVKACGGYSAKNKREVMFHYMRHQQQKLGTEAAAGEGVSG